MAVKTGYLGDNADTFMLIFFADALSFSVDKEGKLEMEIQFMKNVPYPT